MSPKQSKVQRKVQTKVKVWSGAVKPQPAQAQTSAWKSVRGSLGKSLGTSASQPAQTSAPKSTQESIQKPAQRSTQRSAQRSTWKSTLFTGIALTTAAGMVLGGSWVAVQMIVNPGAVQWLSRILPNWESGTTARPQTLADISAEVARSGATSSIDQPLLFSSYPGITQRQSGARDLLLPILQPHKHCARPLNPSKGQQACSKVVELRVYRLKSAATSTRSATYELIDRVAIAEPEEMIAIAPLSQAAITQGTTRTLPLTEVQFMAGQAPTADLWVHLSGEWKRGSRVLYGQIFRYDPEQGQLDLMQNWSSPAGQLPRWQQITGSPTTELVINQSIGLEPQFQVYQLRPTRSLIEPVILEAIGLTESALNDPTYRNSLLLARHGLWSLAQSRLQNIKQERPSQWSAAAQAQLDVIALHAQVTQAQADQDWASPTQQILSQLMDGRWAQSLQVLKSAHRSGYDVEQLLKSNAERLWQRVEAAIKINPKQADLHQWGALILSVQQSREQALTWLKKQPRPATPIAIEQTLALLDSVSNPLPPALSGSPSPLPTPSKPAASPPPTTPLTLIGSATPTAAPSSLTVPAGHTWYAIDVLEYQPGQNWQKVSFIEAEAEAETNKKTTRFNGISLQLVAWQEATPTQTFTVNVKAVQAQQGSLTLLATGQTFSAAKPVTLIAITPETVHWLQALSITTLNQLAQQPNWQTSLPQLWQDLQTAQLVSATPQPPDLAQLIGNWSVQQMELTGDQSPEAVLTIEAPTTPPRTLIFSATGRVLYSDLKEPNQSVVALVERAAGTPTLIVKTDSGLQLQLWSEQARQFRVDPE